MINYNQTNLIHTWSANNKLPLNDIKCVVLHFNRSNPHTKYFLGFTQLISETMAKDLGIFVDVDLSFNQHVSYVTKKSYKLINLIFRSFRVKSSDLYVKMFYVYMIPVATYCIL